MVLYEADISKLATPVKNVRAHKKAKETPPQVETPAPKPETKKRKSKKLEQEIAEAIEETKVEPQPEKKKRKLSEKQKEALAKGQAKLAEIRQVPTPKVETPKRAPEDVEVPKPKRQRKKKEPTPEPEPEPIKEEKPKRSRQKRDPSAPPTWFQKYVEGVKKEQALQREEKVPAKQVKVEAEEVAKKSWDNGFIRDRVTNEVDGHMSRMYSMIFSGR